MVVVLVVRVVVVVVVVVVGAIVVVVEVVVVIEVVLVDVDTEVLVPAGDSVAGEGERVGRSHPAATRTRATIGSVTSHRR